MFRNNKNIYFSDPFYLEGCLCLRSELKMFFSNFTLCRSDSSVVKGWAPSHLAADSVAVCNTCGIFLAWPHSGLRLFSWEHCQVDFISDHFRVPATVSAMFYLSLQNFLQKMPLDIWRASSWCESSMARRIWQLLNKALSYHLQPPHLFYLWTDKQTKTYKRKPSAWHFNMGHSRFKGKQVFLDLVSV